MDWLRWFGTLLYCDVLPVEVNIEIKNNFINVFFYKIGIYLTA